MNIVKYIDSHKPLGTVLHFGQLVLPLALLVICKSYIETINAESQPYLFTASYVLMFVTFIVAIFDSIIMVTYNKWKDIPQVANDIWVSSILTAIVYTITAVSICKFGESVYNVAAFWVITGCLCALTVSWILRARIIHKMEEEKYNKMMSEKDAMLKDFNMSSRELDKLDNIYQK